MQRLFCLKAGGVQAGLWIEMRETKGWRGQRGDVEAVEEIHQGGGPSKVQRGGLKLEKSSISWRHRWPRGPAEGSALIERCNGQSSGQRGRQVQD